MRELDPMKAKFSDPANIKCKDCVFRDKGKIDVDGRTICYGVTKDECEIYKKPNYKPTKILFNEANCEYYVSETFEKNL